MESLFAVIAATVISLLGAGGFLVWSHQAVENVQNAVMASVQSVFNKGAAQYVSDFASTIQASSTATSPVTVTVAILQAAGAYLPPGFTGSNPYKQTWQLQVLQPLPGQLQAITMSTGGIAISDPKQLVAIAGQVGGAEGGFVPYAGQFGSTMTTANAYGTYGAWGPVSLASYANPGSGHLVSLLSFASATNASGNGYLYRVTVPGHPELNDMQTQTDLGMTGTDGTAHNITGANVISGQSLAALSDGTEAVPSVTMANGKIIGWNDVAAGGVLGLVGTNGEYVFLESNNGTFTLVNSAFSGPLFTVDQSGNVVAQGMIQPGNVATPRGSCTGTGIAGDADGSGTMFSCQLVSAGVREWLPIGGLGLREAYWAVQNGSVVPAPTCPAGGTPPAIAITGTNFSVDTTATVNLAPVTGTGPWTVNFTDGTGAAIVAKGTAETYCTF
jgi:hypothetical protein